MLRFITIRMILLASVLTGCDSDLAIFLPPASAPIRIESAANLITNETYTLSWTKAPGVKKYDVAIARDEACTDIVFEKRNLAATSLELDALNDGQYYMCVYAQAAIRSPAVNNGVLLTIDRTRPSVQIPTDIKVAASPFRPEIDVQDTTEFTVSWSQVSGEGKVTFDNSNTQWPLVTADKNGVYKLIAKITDQAGHSVDQEFQFYWEGSGVGLEFTALARNAVATDGYVTAAESSNTYSLWVLAASGFTSALYTQALSDSNGLVTCDAAQSYSSANIPTAVDLNVDGKFVICVKLNDALAKIIYGKSEVITRKTIGPQVTSFAKSNVASDGIISSAEMGSGLPLWTLTQSGADAIAFTTALSDSGSTLSCDTSKTYNQTTLPAAIDITTDGTYAVCVRLTDSLGNTAYSKSDTVVRAANGPSFISLSGANAATDGYINDSEKNSSTAAWSLSQVGGTSIAYTAPILDNTSTVVCDATQTYGLTTTPAINTVPSDGLWVICVRLTDIATNLTYGKSTALTRDTVAPVFTSLAAANAATDGFINDSEKLLVNALWTLSASSYSLAAYTTPLDDTGAALLCDATQTYNQSAIPTPSNILSDLAIAACVKLTDSAGNITFGKSVPVVRDTAAPVFTSLNGANEASDGIINDSEKAATGALFTLIASQQNSTDYTAIQSDSGSALVCDASQTYNSSTLPTINSLSSDGPYALCVKLVDAAGNTIYRKSATIARTTTGPSITSLALANAATDGYINDSEKALTTALWTLTQTGGTSIAYTSLLDDTSPVTCNSSKTYDQSSVPGPSDLTSDNPWVICVKVSDTLGNITYGKSAVVERDIVAPVFTSLALANAATDTYINDSEKLMVSLMWTLSATGHSSAAYTLALSDTAGAAVCDATQNYNQSTIATPADLSSDGAYALCVRLTDAAGNIRFGKSVQLTRDSVAPVFTSMVGANGASDNYISDAEKASGLALYTLSGSDYSTDDFTAALDDTSGTVACDSSQTYGNPNIPVISSIATDGTYIVCALLSDAAGNHGYGKSSQVVRDTTGPTLTSLALAGAATDGYINDAEKALTTAMWALNASGHSGATYTTALSDTSGALVCDSSKTYGQSSIANPSTLSSDGAYALCTRLVDAAGNITYGKSDQLTRSITFPSFVSLVKANEAVDGFIAGSEKTSILELYALSATGQSGEDYSAALSDSGGTLACDNTQTYGSTTIPTVASITTDGTYVVCVQLKNAPLNYTYGKSQSVVRDTTAPTVTVNTLSTTDLTPPLSGTIDDATASISVTVNNHTYTATNNGDGTWSIADNVLYMTGTNTYDVTARGTDSLGNFADDSTSGELTITAPAFVSTWKTDNAGSSGSNEITLPLRASGTYNFVVQWGDGRDDIITAHNAPTITHTYTSPGTYTVIISNVITGWSFKNTGDKLKLMTISKWGPLKFGNDAEYFRGCTNLAITATDIPDLTGTTTFQAMFQSTPFVSIPNLASWNVSAVTNMEDAFAGATNFNQSINAWNVSSVTNMKGMFYQAAAFNQDLNSWNTGAVTNLIYTFAEASSFNGNISSWNTSAVTSLFGTFFKASSFNSNVGSWITSSVTSMALTFAETPFNQNINSWNVSQVQSFEGMFRATTAFNQPLASWNLASAKNLRQMFGWSVFNQPLAAWNVSTVEDFVGMFCWTTAFNQPLNGWNVSSAKDMAEMFWKSSVYNQPLSNWNVGNVEVMQSMFHDAVFNQDISSWNVSRVLDFNEMFRGNTNFNQPIGSWALTVARNLGSMFNGATAFNQNLSSWTTGTVDNMEYMFAFAPNFNSNIGGWDVSNVTKMNSMFERASTFHQNLNSWVTSKVTNMAWMFADATAFNGDITSWNTALVNNMEHMFWNARAFNQAIGSWNTGLVTSMGSMFEGTPFNQAIGSWNVSNVTNMNWMFAWATSFNQDLTNWNTGAVVDMEHMFFQNWAFNGNVVNWNVSNVTKMASMFEQANAFNQNIGGWNVGKVTNFQSMFYGADVFNQSLSSWDVSKATTMGWMFFDAYAFNQDIGNWSPLLVTAMNNMFENSGLSQTNYTNALVGWNNKPLQNNVTLGAGNKKYLAGATAAHANLIGTRGWTINDGGLGP
ncbi:MAG: BspA family leucine-rich repeat surface protein [Bdellovibrionota bacterium]